MIGESIQKFIDAQMNNGIKTKIGDLIAIRKTRNDNVDERSKEAIRCLMTSFCAFEALFEKSSST